MNELQLLRKELAAQRRHARELSISRVESATYDEYLALIIGLETHRIASHLARLRPRLDMSETERRLLERCTSEFERLTAQASASCPTAFEGDGHAPGALPSGALTRKADLVMRLSALSEELETIAVSRYGIEDWRRAAHVDADSILEERRLRKKVLEQAHGRPCS